jgi:hypothetical protein
LKDKELPSSQQAKQPFLSNSLPQEIRTSAIHFFALTTTTFLQSKVASLASNARSGGSVGTFMSPSNTVTQQYFQTLGFLSIGYQET